ncbi:MAG: hypothetical protein ACOC1X_00025 [Promethearchaeota archaeon]
MTNKKINKNKDKQKDKKELVDFKNYKVPKREIEFWKDMMEIDDSFLKSAKVAKKTNRIEDAIAQGTVSTYRQLEHSTYLDSILTRAHSIWGDFPILGKIILKEMGMQRHIDGQHQKMLLEFYKYHAQQENEVKWRKKFKNFADSIKSKLGMI